MIDNCLRLPQNTPEERIMTDLSQSRQWTFEEARALYEKPFMDLMFEAQTVLRGHFPANKMQMSTLLSIKTGACPEDCNYCAQSGHFKTGIEKEKLMPLDKVIEAAERAKASGATRFCMGAAWRNPPEKAMPEVLEMVKAVKAMGMETCLTAGMLDDKQAYDLKDAGLDFYNHNLDTSREYYPEIVTTRTYDDRLDTLAKVRDAGMSVCCGGIMNLGETRDDRINLLLELANMQPYPESVPINKLVPMPGTPLANKNDLDQFDFIRTIALARIMMPKTYVRLSAGRNSMTDEMQTLCFLAGVNSIFYGEKLLVTKLPEQERDIKLMKRLGISALTI
jgi:biotin synthase